MAEIAVFGGSSGIGAALMKRLVARGDKVVSIARRPAAVGLSIIADMRNTNDRSKAVARAKALLGGLDAVVYATGVARHEATVSEAALQETLDVNLAAAIVVGEAAIAEGCTLVFIASTLADSPIAQSVAYSASKAGLIGAAKAFALRGEVHVISPGLVDTPMIAGRNLPGPLASPDEIAEQIEELL